MPNNHCLLDTSALLKRYFKEDGTETIDELFDRKDCARHIINITIAEILGVFFRARLQGEIDSNKAKKLKDVFKKDRQDSKIVVHSIHQGNISPIQKFYDASAGIPAPTYRDDEGKLKTRNRIGPVDVLVLTAYEEIKKNYGKNTFLFSSDRHMLDVADRMGFKICDPEQISGLPF